MLPRTPKGGRSTHSPRAVRPRPSPTRSIAGWVAQRERTRSWPCSRCSPARERREPGLGDRHAVEPVAPWMGLPEVAAQKGSPIHAIVRRVADEDVFALKARRRYHLENHLAAERTNDLVRAGAAEKRQARQVPLDDIRALLDHP